MTKKVTQSQCVVPKDIHTSPTEEIFSYTTPPPPTSLEIPVKLHTLT